jgi:O-acetyl-ADP-ribose deacetylase (regulator of RNase III)
MNVDVPLDDGYIQISIGDITRQNVDAIVNAANSSLLGGGGVDGAIHRVAGPELLEACRKIGGCPPGEARITPGFRLPAKHVIHTVGPIWKGGTASEDDILRRCYRSTLAMAAQFGVRSIAFPAISTGAYGFPGLRAARIAVAELRDGADRYEDLSDIRVICFSASTFADYEQAIESLLD